MNTELLDPDAVSRGDALGLMARKIESMTAHILTPYPGTRLYQRLLAE